VNISSKQITVFCVVTYSGHEDVDQVFGQTAGHIARNEFDTSNDVVELLDSASRPLLSSEQARQRGESSKTARRQAGAEKLDEVADWKIWVARVGIKMKGIRI
jgi:hypothetical protein